MVPIKCPQMERKMAQSWKTEKQKTVVNGSYIQPMSRKSSNAEKQCIKWSVVGDILEYVVQMSRGGLHDGGYPEEIKRKPDAMIHRMYDRETPRDYGAELCIVDGVSRDMSSGPRMFESVGVFIR